MVKYILCIIEFLHATSSHNQDISNDVMVMGHDLNLFIVYFIILH